MPEALAIFSVAFITIVTLVVLGVKARNPALYDVRREQARLEQHVKWLEERIAVARHESWEPGMTGNLTADYAVSVEQLAQLKVKLTATEVRVT